MGVPQLGSEVDCISVDAHPIQSMYREARCGTGELTAGEIAPRLLAGLDEIARVSTEGNGDS